MKIGREKEEEVKIHNFLIVFNHTLETEENKKQQSRNVRKIE